MIFLLLCLSKIIQYEGKMKKPLKFVVIGSGYWGINYVRLLSHCPGISLIAICEESDNRIIEVRERFPDVRIIKDFSDLLDEDFDAAVVATNPDGHYELTKRLLERGKHVLVEKPITTRSSEAQELMALSREKNLVLMVGHIFLYNSGVRKVKEYIDSGRLGKLYYLYSQRTNLGPIRDDVNAVWDLAPHDIAIFNYLLGSAPEWVSGVGSSFLKPKRSDVGFLTLGYSKDIIGNIHVSWADPNKERKVVVVGSKGRIVFDDISQQQKVIVYKKGVAASSSLNAVGFGAHQVASRNGDIFIPEMEIGEPLKQQMEHFFDCVMNNKQPISDGINGYEVVKILESVDESMIKNGTPVEVNFCIGEKE